MSMPFKITAFDHIRLYVGNAKQAAHFYQSVYGFKLAGYRGLEQGDREKVSYVVSQNDATFVLDSALSPKSPINDHLAKHGDGVKDVAFRVDNAATAWEHTTSKGAKSVHEPMTLEDGNGKLVISAIHTYGDTIHTFVERNGYDGPFMPGYDEATSLLKPLETGLKYVDHVVGNQPAGEMEKVVQFYEDVFGFHRLWTVDDKDISTDYTALRSVVVASEDEVIKMPINEPAAGKKKSQIEEYVEFYSGAGVQHVALETGDILTTIQNLVANGCEFLYVPDTYYDSLAERVGKIDEEIPVLKKLGILVDRDDDGYLLQLFTKPVQDRPTLFYEIIQRKDARSFGKGNFKALFESIEREQARRGTL